MSPDLVLPALIYSREFESWDQYLQALYIGFSEDFLSRSNRPFLRGKPVFALEEPGDKNKVKGFWHLISSGAIEDERLVEYPRCERIRWPRAMIDATTECALPFWPSPRPRQGHRMVLSLKDFSYKVILDARSSRFVLITAYPVEQEHERHKLKRAYELYLKTTGAA